MALSTITNGLSGLTARTRINAAISAINGLVVPKLLFVETTGVDASAEVGNPAKPYETVDAAIVAGEATGQPYTIMLGAGNFTMNRKAASANRKAFVGVGPQTILSLSNSGMLAGQTGLDLTETILNLTVVAATSGFSPSADTEQPTSAGLLTLRGNGWVLGLSAGGGSAYNPSADFGAAGGAVDIRGDFVFLPGSYVYSNSGTNGDGTGGDTYENITFDLCKLLDLTMSGNGNVTISRCAYIGGFGGAWSGTLNDKGGNALW